MKNAILLHGSSSSPDSFWLPSIQKYLESKGYSVWCPQLPRPEAPDLKLQLPFVLDNADFNSETILIGHSSGCPLILSILEHIDVKIQKAILVAGYARKLGKMGDESLKKLETDAEPILQDSYDWQKIKNNVQELIYINSDNDPWGCDDSEGVYMREHVGGRLIVTHDGHMGSEKFNQPYLHFPLLEQLLD
jgi:predicted alpha/beta hydrolase family esterase